MTRGLKVADGLLFEVWEHRMLNAVRVAAIRHCFGEQEANTMFALRLPQNQHATIGRLVVPAKSTVSFLRRTDGRSNGSGVRQSTGCRAVAQPKD